MSYTELKAKHVQIRKPRVCVGCAFEYPKGMKLFHRVYIWEGEFNSDYLCKNCEAVMDGMDSGDLADGFMQGDLREGWQYLENID